MDNAIGYSNLINSDECGEFSNISNFNLLFYLGLFFIPFDNLFFAPSSGWATIAPFFFLFYLILNIKNISIHFKKIDILLLLAFFMIGPIHGLLYGEAYSIVESIGTIILGFSFYFSLKIYSNSINSNLKNVGLILFFAYLISYIYGLVSLIPNDSVDSFLRIIEKRHYVRLHFSFTEPSFISMHLYGVIFPIAIYFKYKKLFILGILFLITTLLFGESARFYLDTIIIVGLYGIYKMNQKGLKYVFIFIVLGFLSLITLYLIVKYLYPRLLSIYENGVYSDNSLAARWFRVNAIIHGIDLKGFFLGYGLSNTWIPFNNGYSYALSQYDNTYLVEINNLANTRGSSFYCMPLRIISEMGIFALLVCFLKLASKKYWFYFLIIIWLYLQFDSYAFYAVWIYLFIKGERNDFCNSSNLQY